MEKLKPRTLSGFMELLPAPQQKFERMLEILRKNFALYGFTPIDTPIIESAEILLAKGGGETEKQIYRFQKGDSDLALRFDHTVPLAKYVALHENELCFPFRRYAIGKVYRGERAQRGRFREFYQADIDIIGDGKLSVVNEAEIPSIIYKVFSEFGLKRFCISVNNRKILNGFYAMLGLTEKSGDIMRTVDKLDKIGPDKVRVILVEDIGLSEQDADEILRFIAIRGTNAEVLERLEAYRGRDEAFDTGLDELTTVTKYLAAFGVPEENFAVDLTIARGLDYYTGTVYETRMLDHPEIGAICAGGRYDNLAEYYSDRSLPAAVELATRFRNAGLRTQIYSEQKKFKAKMTYADKLGIPYVAFLGEDEIAQGTCSVKDLRTGQQVSLSPDEAVELIRKGISELNKGSVILEK